METNALPRYDMSENPTNCCPRFHPEGWDEQDLHFKDKLFVKANSRSLLHIPINMGKVFEKTFDAIMDSDAFSEDDCIILTRALSPWTTEHFFSTTKEVPGLEMTRLNGDYLTRVFEGPYKNEPQWKKDMQSYVASKGKEIDKLYFFYTTCPKCSKYYGENYAVAVAKLKS